MFFVIVAVGLITLFWSVGKRYLFGDHKPFRWAFAGLLYQWFVQVPPLVSANSATLVRDVSFWVLVLLAGGIAGMYYRPGLLAVVYLTVLEVFFLVVGLLGVLVSGRLLGLLPAAVALFVIGALVVGYLRLRQARHAAISPLE